MTIQLFKTLYFLQVLLNSKKDLLYYNDDIIKVRLRSLLLGYYVEEVIDDIKTEEDFKIELQNKLNNHFLNRDFQSEISFMLSKDIYENINPNLLGKKILFKLVF